MVFNNIFFNISLYFTYIYNYIINWFNSLIVIKNVEVVNKNKISIVENKTKLFYLSYFFNFKIFNREYYKICVETKEGIYKVFTNSTFKNANDNLKKSEITLINKLILSFKINDIEFINYLNPFLFYNNSVFDFIIFNKSKNKIHIVKSIKYRIFGSDNEKEIKNLDTILNQMK